MAIRSAKVISRQEAGSHAYPTGFSFKSITYWFNGNFNNRVPFLIQPIRSLNLSHLFYSTVAIAVLSIGHSFKAFPTELRICVVVGSLAKKI